jgi:hypothetical protein
MQFIENLINAFNQEILPSAYLNEKEFKKAIKDYYKFNTVDELVKIIESKFMKLKKEANLENYIPVER